jgi:hypothetical protein
MSETDRAVPPAGPQARQQPSRAPPHRPLRPSKDASRRCWRSSRSCIIVEIIARVDGNQIDLMIHWQGPTSPPAWLGEFTAPGFCRYTVTLGSPSGRGVKRTSSGLGISWFCRAIPDLSNVVSAETGAGEPPADVLPPQKVARCLMCRMQVRIARRAKSRAE